MGKSLLLNRYVNGNSHYTEEGVKTFNIEHKND